jgi:predicted nuclease of predicted toxin-antitoxin system
MARFLVDESLPKSLATELVNSGHEAVHTTSIGLQGAPDDKVHAEAVARASILLTADLGFGDTRRYAPRFGTVIVRFRRNLRRAILLARVLSLLSDSEQDLRDMPSTVLLLEPGRRRVRKF